MEHVFLTDNFRSPRWEKLSGTVHITESADELKQLVEKKGTSELTFWLAAEHNSTVSVAAYIAKENGKFVVLYSKPEAENLVTLLSFGARGYTSLAASTSVMERITAVIHQGGLWIPEQFLANLTGLSQKKVNNGQELPSSFAILSERERQVCEKVLAGLTNQKIADALFISERTVKEHLTKSFRKLGVKDRLQLVLKARKEESAELNHGE
ncbi:response regulator transcription factor [Idiomarina aminovorans]|uniref:response regulator transcription factor n=1 Tax=Idiomarina aminovorans TaxID=2914829 RepID=UPI0020057C2B|nr:response regulator transcription factor [Idiomarina sp. ATCH4]MCK7460341.1 response regulator transcription factor [Idiomarina sp. ATCH4]